MEINIRLNLTIIDRGTRGRS